MADSPVPVTPIFDELVEEFGLRNGTSPAGRGREAAAAAETPVEETATEARPGTAM